MKNYLDLIRRGNLALSVNRALEEVKREIYPLSELRDALIDGLKYTIRLYEGVTVDVFMGHVIESYKQYLKCLERGESITMLLPSGRVTIPAEK